MTVAPATGGDATAVLEMLRRCSATTLFHRFHGPSDGTAYTRDVLDRPSGRDTLLAWDGCACVGMATLADDTDGVAHLGVLVEDSWQRHGVGTQLVATLIDRSRRRGVSRVHADVLGEDSFIVRALHRIGRLTVTIEAGVFVVDIDINNQSRTESPSPA